MHGWIHACVHRCASRSMAALIGFGVAIGVLAVGCVTPYQPEGATGGYSDIALSDNMFKVRFRGNGFTSEERAADLSLLRAAELTLERGYRYFVIVNAEKKAEVSEHTQISQGFDGSLQSRTYTVEKPKAENTILCFHERPEQYPVVYDAQVIKASIRQRYGL